MDFRSRLVVGQICFAPVCFTYEESEIWRPTFYDQSKTSATHFEAIAAPGDAYKLPNILLTPSLHSYEEFPVIRAKKRPVVLLAVTQPHITVKEPINMAKVNKKLLIVAPCYGVANPMGKYKFPPEFIQRVRVLEFPQFLFLPQGGSLAKDSLLRLDSIHHCFHSQLEPTEWQIAPDIWSIISGQLERIFGTGEGRAYVEARQTLMA